MYCARKILHFDACISLFIPRGRKAAAAAPDAFLQYSRQKPMYNRILWN